MTHRHIQTHTAEHELAQKIPGAPTVWGTTNELDRKKKYEKSTRQSSFEPFFPAWFVFFLVYHGSGQSKKKEKSQKHAKEEKGRQTAFRFRLNAVDGWCKWVPANSYTSYIHRHRWTQFIYFAVSKPHTWKHKKKNYARISATISTV